MSMSDARELSKIPKSSLAVAALVADRVSAAHTFEDYRSRKAPNTIKRQDVDLRSFLDYLGVVGVTIPDGLRLELDAQAWNGISAGLVDGFVKWLSNEGASIGTINVRLSTVKTYVGLAAKSQVIGQEAADRIRMVSGYRHKEGLRLDERRPLTRIGEKKAAPVSLTTEQVNRMRRSRRTQIGMRDTLIVNLLADLGLRCGEVAAIKVENIDLERRSLTFYREKVDLTQTHHLTDRIVNSLRIYLKLHGAPTSGPLLRAVTRIGKLGKPLKNHGIAKRIRALGEEIGIPNLSPHDLRHYWATQAARNKTPIDRLQDAGGWKSPNMPLRYIEKTKVANEGVILEKEG
jgi:integrase